MAILCSRLQTIQRAAYNFEMDFEEDLEVYCVRKALNVENEDQRLPGIGNTKNLKVFDYIPVTLRFLSTLGPHNWREKNVMTVFSSRIHFRNCLVYGTVFGKREREHYYTFALDDSTDCIEMSVSRQHKQLDTVSKLEKELSLIHRQSTAQNKNETAKSLRNLLLATKNQLYSASNLKDGTRVLVYGRPSYFNERIFLDAFHILEDNSSNRSIELAYKDELVDWHKNNVLLS